MKNKPLFSSKDLGSYLSQKETAMNRAIEGYGTDPLLKTPIADLSEYFAQTYTVAPISLDIDSSVIDQSETQVDVSRDPQRMIRDRSRPFYIAGTLVTLSVPYTGNSQLFDMQGNHWSTKVPMGEVRSSELAIHTEVVEHDASALKTRLDQEIETLRWYVDAQSAQIRAWNVELGTKAASRISARRERLLKDRGMVETLGFPMRRRPEGLGNFPPPELRRKPPISPPPTASGVFEPQPELPAAEYDHILGLIEKASEMLERSPQAFSSMGEEDIRTSILLTLNTHYYGSATGETFNKGGKTDILIRSEGGNVFVAECKFWKGAKAFLETIDQLLGYVTWRDTKAAILIFNRNKDFSQVLSEIPTAAESHASHKRRLGTGPRSSRHVFSHPDDAGREVTVTIMAFDVPRKSTAI